jgi:hypothetical protein
MFFLSPVVHSNSVKQLEDVVYLKDGSIIRGTLIEQVPGETIKIETRDGNVFVIKIAQIEKFTKEPLIDNTVKAPGNKAIGNQKNGVLAFVFSFILPGGGQFYNGEIDKGALMLGMSVVGVMLLMNDRDTNNNFFAEPNGTGKIGVLFMLTGGLWSLIDAPISAARINRENEIASGFRISDNIYVDLGMSDYYSKETTFIRAVVSF